MNDWYQDETKPYLWHHNEKEISLISYTNDHDPDIKCIWVRMLHDGEFVSNYFTYSQKSQEMLPMEMAMKLVEDFAAKTDPDEQ